MMLTIQTRENTLGHASGHAYVADMICKIIGVGVGPVGRRRYLTTQTLVTKHYHKIFRCVESSFLYNKKNVGTLYRPSAYYC